MMRALWLSLLLPLVMAGSSPTPPGPNVSYSRPPDYSLTRDDGDANQLFDGFTALGTMWLSRLAVGWSSGARPIEISVTLPKPALTRGVCLHGARNSAAQVSFAARLTLFVADGRGGWAWGGESRPAEQAGEGGYRAEWFCIPTAVARIDAVKLVVVPKGDYFFVDEMRMMPAADGPTELANPPHVQSDDLSLFVRHRLALERSLGGLKTDLAHRGVLAIQLHSLEAWIDRLAKGQAGRNEAELRDAADAASALVARTLGRNGETFQIERSAPYAAVDQLSAPAMDNTPITLFPGVHRIVAVNVRNVGATENVRLSVQTDGLAQSLRVSTFVTGVVLSDEGRYVADPLIPVNDGNVKIPSGQVRQIYIDLTTVGIGTGHAMLTLLATDGRGTVKKLQVGIDIAPVMLSSPPATAVWGYLSDRVILRFPEQASADMRDHQVTDAVLPRASMPWPVGVGSAAMPYRKFDADLDILKSDRRYLFYLGFDASALPPFGGAQPFSARWKAGFVAWIADWRTHLMRRGLAPTAYAFYPVDEASDAVAVHTIVETSALIKSVDPSLQVFATLRDPAQINNTLIHAVDIFDLTGPALSEPTIARLRSAGKTVLSYAAEGGGKAADPGDFYRRLGWQAAAFDLAGFGFWSYSDIGMSGTAWDDTDGVRRDPAVVYDTTKGLISSRRWEAWREGVWDYRLIKTAMRAATSAVDRAAIRNLAARGAMPGIKEDEVEAIRKTLAERVMPICHGSCEPQ